MTVTVPVTKSIKSFKMTSKVETTTMVKGGPLCGGPRTCQHEHTLMSSFTPPGFGPSSPHLFGCLFVPVAFSTLHLSIYETFPLPADCSLGREDSRLT